MNLKYFKVLKHRQYVYEGDQFVAKEHIGDDEKILPVQLPFFKKMNCGG